MRYSGVAEAGAGMGMAAVESETARHRGAVAAPAGRAVSDSIEDITMPAPSSAKPLYRIDECPDLMADGCVGDEQGNLVFLSIWARDTAVQEFLARLTLGRDEQGLDQFHVITEQGASVPVFVGNVESLEKRSARAYRRTLFGSLTNIWLFDRRCVRPDKANASALALLPRDSAHRLDRLWTLVQDTCPLPLLDHWRETVLELLQSQLDEGYISTPEKKKIEKRVVERRLDQLRAEGVRVECGVDSLASGRAISFAHISLSDQLGIPLAGLSGKFSCREK